MPRWNDENREILETYEERKAREEKLFDDNKPLKFLPFSNVCSKEATQNVLSQLYGSNYGLLNIGEPDLRNLFVTWCLGAKNMKPAEVQNMDVAAASAVFEEFQSDVTVHGSKVYCYFSGKRTVG